MVFLKPRSRIEMIRQLKQLHTPKAIVFVGMHAEKEATDVLPEREVDGKPLHYHFPNAVFVRVPQKYTTSKVFAQIDRIVQAYLQRLSEGSEKLAGYSAQDVRPWAEFLLHSYGFRKPQEGLRKDMPTVFPEVEHLIRQQLSELSFPDEFKLIEEARKIHPNSIMINVHGYNGSHSVVRSIKFKDECISAINDSKIPFGVECRRPKVSDVLVELRIPQRHLSDNTLSYYGEKESTFELDSSTQRVSSYLRTLKRDEPEVQQLFDQHAGHLKGFLEHFLKHL